MEYLRATEAFVVPQRNLLTCPTCGSLMAGQRRPIISHMSPEIRAVIDPVYHEMSVLIFECGCDFKFAAALTKEGVLYANIPRPARR